MRNALTLVVVLLACIVGLGYYLNWFNFSTRHDPNDDKKVSLTVQVDTEKIKEDTEAAKLKAKELGKTVKENVESTASSETAKGAIVNVEEAGNRLVVATTDKKELTIQMGPEAKVRLKDKELSLKELRKGDQVTVVYKIKDGQNIAQSVTVERAG